MRRGGLGEKRGWMRGVGLLVLGEGVEVEG